MSEEKNQEKEPIKFTFTAFVYVIAAIILFVAILCALVFIFGTTEEVELENDTGITYNEEIIVEDDSVEVENTTNDVTNSTLMTSNVVSNEVVNTQNDVELPESNVVETNGSNIVEGNSTEGNQADSSNSVTEPYFPGTANSAYVPNN